jgi:hypothetical protein
MLRYAMLHTCAFADLLTGWVVTRYNLSGAGGATVPLLLMPLPLAGILMAGPAGLCVFAVLHTVCAALKGKAKAT